jgi:large subunit ribosomal protein L29
MSNSNIAELRKKTVEELQAYLLELSREGVQLRIQKAVGQLTKTHQVKEHRRNIARAKTVLCTLELRTETVSS